MKEKNIEIVNIEPLELYGVNENKLKIIKRNFPKLKIIARGSKLKLIGSEKEIKKFEKKFNLIINFYNKFKKISENDILKILENGSSFMLDNNDEEKIIVYGPNGFVVKAKTENQLKLVKKVQENDMVFAIGPAGSGKTYTSVALAVRALKNKEIKKIILTRPAVETGENLGFLPGDLKEKLDPYLQPLYDALRDMINPDKLNEYLSTGIIQIAPLAFMRGRTLDNAFVILDEAQNSTENQIKMFLTRMGKSAKFIITGDITQIDLPKNQPSGLLQAIKLLKNINGIEFVFFDKNDVIRHPLVKDIIEAFKNSF